MKFSYNNAQQTSLKCSPFYANYGYNPNFTIDLRSKPTSSVPAAKHLADTIAKLHEHLVENLKYAQNQQARYHDAKHKRVEFKVGEKVWLLSTNIRSQRPSKKLDWKRIGPYTIKRKVGTQAYQLDLPRTLKLHNVFHVSLLEPYKSSTIRKHRPPPPPIIIDSFEEYEVEKILDSKRFRKQLKYLIKWEGYPVSENSWEPAAHLKNAPDLVKEFHRRYPAKPGPHNLTIIFAFSATDSGPTQAIPSSF